MLTVLVLKLARLHVVRDRLILDDLQLVWLGKIQLFLLYSTENICADLPGSTDARATLLFEPNPAWMLTQFCLCQPPESWYTIRAW